LRKVNLSPWGPLARTATPVAPVAPPIRLPGSRARTTQLAALALSYLSIALLIRGISIGDPVIHIDEQFYLLVGDRMLHGALPYVDIWDRKPIGLFLLYAGIRLLGGVGIYQYQAVALASAAATALVVHRLARMIAPPAGAWLAGVAYLLYLSAFNCFGGQAPVFYDLPMALAALLLVRAATGDAERLALRGFGAMALVGLAIQIKYTAVFEGFAFGLVLVWRALGSPWRDGRVVVATTLWAGTALAPTLAAWGWYAAIGHGAEFAQANFLSIFAREESFAGSLIRLGREGAALGFFPLAIFGLPHARPPAGGDHPAALPLLRLWGIAACAGFLVFGTWYDHYVAPLLVPLSVLAAPRLGDWRRTAYAVLLIGFGVIAAAYTTTREMRTHGNAAQIDRIADLIGSELNGGCAYLNEGDPILYHLTGACLATRWPFPNHLAGTVDQHALGVDLAAETTRIMASRPAVVMISALPISQPTDTTTRAIVLRGLTRNYMLYAKTRVGTHSYLLYRLRPARIKGKPVDPRLASG
jgi:hypothetical protein